jgi:hypothetical protein
MTDLRLCPQSSIRKNYASGQPEELAVTGKFGRYWGGRDGCKAGSNSQTGQGSVKAPKKAETKPNLKMKPAKDLFEG